MDLSALGIREGTISESIVTTFHSDGKPNAAPMGVIGLGANELMVRVHKKTDTYENIVRSRCCVVNIVFDPYLFLRCSLYGSYKGSREIESDRTRLAALVDAPYLVDAHAYIASELVGLDEVVKKDWFGRSMISEMKFRVLGIEVLKPFPIAPNRGLFAAIELAILLSRGRPEDFQKYLDVINKTLPRDESKKIDELVNEFLAKL